MRRVTIQIENTLRRATPGRSICAEISCPTSTQAELRTWPYYLLILPAIISAASQSFFSRDFVF